MEGLARCYFLGQGGIKKDKKEAVRLWTLAAEKGNASAQNNLAICYHTGQGIKRDREKAINLWVQSAKQGHVSARQHLEDPSQCVTS